MIDLPRGFDDEAIELDGNRWKVWIVPKPLLPHRAHVPKDATGAGYRIRP